MKPLVKVCGIKELNILKELVNLDKIDFLGFIFYENSPRFISDDLVNRINKIDLRDKRPVCVYVDADKDFIKETSSNFEAGITYLASSGEDKSIRIWRINSNANSNANINANDIDNNKNDNNNINIKSNNKFY